MIKFDSPREWFKVSGLRIYYFQLLNFIFCLPLFHFGTWIQVEPTMLAIFSAGSLTAMWLAFGIYKRWLVVERPIHPLIMVLGAWALWQIVPIIFTGNPLHVWLGPAEQGEGAAFHVVLVLTTFMAIPLLQEDKYRKKILSVAALSMCIMAYLHFDTRMIYDPMKGTPDAYSFYFADNPLAPSNWPDYLAFIAAWLWIAYAASPTVKTPIRNVIATMLFIWVLFTSMNKSGYFFIFPLFFASIALLILQSKNKIPNFLSRILQAEKQWKILAMLGIILPLGWIVASQYYNFAETSYSFKDSAEHIKNCKEEYMFLCKHIDITERAAFNKTAWEAMKDNPSSLLTGRGWGSFTGDLFSYEMVDGIRSYKDGEFAPNFENLFGLFNHWYDFHSHNQYTSALHALGVIGLLFFTTIPLVAIAYIRKDLFWWCVPVLIGVNALGSMWFFVPQVLAFQALGLGALSTAGKPPKAREHIIQFPRYNAILASIIAAILAISAIEEGRGIIYGVTFYQLKFAKLTPAPPKNIDWMKPDIIRGGDRLKFFIIAYLEEVTKKIEDGTATINDRDWYHDFLEITHEMGTSTNSNAFMRILEAKLSMALLFEFKNPSPLDELKPEVEKNIVSSIIRFSESAPLREDFIAPFLVHLADFTGKDTAKQRKILEQILEVAPNHRSALWLLGAIYEHIPDLKEKGIAMRRKAIALGVDRVYPVTIKEISANQ